MRNIIAVFNNRNGAMQFASSLKRTGVRCKTISTPRELSESCGISVVFLEQDIGRARYVLSALKIGSFKGFYAIIGNDIFKKYQPIY